MWGDRGAAKEEQAKFQLDGASSPRRRWLALCRLPQVQACMGIQPSIVDASFHSYLQANRAGMRSCMEHPTQTDGRAMSSPTGTGSCASGD